MITAIIITALQIIFIHVLFFDGMILGGVRLWYLRVIQKTKDLKELNGKMIDLHKRFPYMQNATKEKVLIVLIGSRIIHGVFFFLKKPLFDCVICMTSIWGTVIYLVEFQHRGIPFIPFLFCVGGVLTLAYGIIGNAEDSNGEQFVKDNGVKKFYFENSDGTKEEMEKPLTSKW